MKYTKTPNPPDGPTKGAANSQLGETSKMKIKAWRLMWAMAAAIVVTDLNGQALTSGRVFAPQEPSVESWVERPDVQFERYSGLPEAHEYKFLTTDKSLIVVGNVSASRSSWVCIADRSNNPVFTKIAELPVTVTGCVLFGEDGAPPNLFLANGGGVLKLDLLTLFIESIYDFSWDPVTSIWVSKANDKIYFYVGNSGSQSGYHQWDSKNGHIFCGHNEPCPEVTEIVDGCSPISALGSGFWVGWDRLIPYEGPHGNLYDSGLKSFKILPNVFLLNFREGLFVGEVGKVLKPIGLLSDSTPTVFYDEKHGLLLAGNAAGIFRSVLPTNKDVGLAPPIVTGPADQTVKVGTTVKLTVAANGSSSLFYQWQKNHADLTESDRFTGVRSNTLEIRGVESDDEALYSVTARNTEGCARADMVLSVSANRALAVGTIRVPLDYPTIQAAIDAAKPGNTIHVAAGIYREKVRFDKSGITLEGEDRKSVILGVPNEAVVTCENLVEPTTVLRGFTIAGGEFGVQIRGSSKLTVENCDCTGYQTVDGYYRNRRAGIRMERGSSAVIIRNDLSGPDRGIEGDGVKSVEIRENVINGCRGSYGGGIVLTDADLAEVRLNTFDNNWDGAINFSNVRNGWILQNTIIGNQGFINSAGMNLHLSPDNIVRIENNVIVSNSCKGNDGAGMSGVGSGTIEFMNNLVADNYVQWSGYTEQIYVSGPNFTAKNNLFISSSAFATDATFVEFGGTGALDFSFNNNWHPEAIAPLKGIELGQGSLAIDPMLNADYTLPIGSPLEDAGDPSPGFKDRDGSRNDIGIFGGAHGIQLEFPGNAPPRVQILSPVSGSVVSGPTNLLVAIKSSDPNGSVAKVELWGGGLKLAEDSTFPFEFNLSLIEPGPFKLFAKAFDETGLSTVSDVVDVTVRVDRHERVLFQHVTGLIGEWQLQGINRTGSTILTPESTGDPQWKLVGSGDFRGDGTRGILFQYKKVAAKFDGASAIWFMDGTTMVQAQFVTPQNPGDGWSAVTVGDFNGDKKADILFQHDDGSMAVWYMNGALQTGAVFLSPAAPRGADGAVDRRWRAVVAADLNGDKKLDIVFQYAGGAFDRTVAVWYMDGSTQTGAALLEPSNPGAGWSVVGSGDFNKDGKSDLLLQHSSGLTGVWHLDGIALLSGALLNPENPGIQWRAVGQ